MTGSYDVSDERSIGPFDGMNKRAKLRRFFQYIYTNVTEVHHYVSSNKQVHNHKEYSTGRTHPSLE